MRAEIMAVEQAALTMVTAMVMRAGYAMPLPGDAATYSHYTVDTLLSTVAACCFLRFSPEMMAGDVAPPCEVAAYNNKPCIATIYSNGAGLRHLGRLRLASTAPRLPLGSRGCGYVFTATPPRQLIERLCAPECRCRQLPCVI